MSKKSLVATVVATVLFLTGTASAWAEDDTSSPPPAPVTTTPAAAPAPKPEPTKEATKEDEPTTAPEAEPKPEAEPTKATPTVASPKSSPTVATSEPAKEPTKAEPTAKTSPTATTSPTTTAKTSKVAPATATAEEPTASVSVKILSTWGNGGHGEVANTGETPLVCTVTLLGANVPPGAGNEENDGLYPVGMVKGFTFTNVDPGDYSLVANCGEGVTDSASFTVGTTSPTPTPTKTSQPTPSLKIQKVERNSFAIIVLDEPDGVPFEVKVDGVAVSWDEGLVTLSDGEHLITLVVDGDDAHPLDKERVYVDAAPAPSGSPSPTASPGGSPTGSPTGSPSGTPSPTVSQSPTVSPTTSTPKPSGTKGGKVATETTKKDVKAETPTRPTKVDTDNGGIDFLPNLGVLLFGAVCVAGGVTLSRRR